jgi:flavin prenyltransferase
MTDGISGATGQKNHDQAKKDEFEHAVILLKAGADSSCFGYSSKDKSITLMAGLKILVAITGASGALYAQRLLDNLDPREHDVNVVQSNYAQQVIAEELPGGLKLAKGVTLHNLKSMNAPFASGSNPPDAMIVIPCTMGTMGRIAHGYSEDVLLRAADVVLKEKKKLILVPRETPLSLVHVKNMELLLLAGATILPANPSFYSGAKTIVQIADTVVARVLDHLGIKNDLAPRWAEEKE